MLNTDWSAWRPWRKIAKEYGIKGDWPMCAKRRDTKPTAVIVDIDGTLVKSYGFSKGGGTKMHDQGLAYVSKMHAEGHVIVIVTARDRESETRSTRNMLRRNMPVPYVGPILRARTDMRHACDYKAGVADSLSEVFDIVGAIDDDQWCLAMWRKRGIETTEALPLAWSRTFDGPLPGDRRYRTTYYKDDLSRELDEILKEHPSLAAVLDDDDYGDYDQPKCRYCNEPEWDYGSELCALHWDEYSGRFG